MGSESMRTKFGCNIIVSLQHKLLESTSYSENFPVPVDRLRVKKGYFENKKTVEAGIQRTCYSYQVQAGKQHTVENIQEKGRFKRNRAQFET